MSQNYGQRNIAKSGKENQSIVGDILGINKSNIRLLKSSVYC